MDTDLDPHRPRCLEDMAGSSEWIPLKTMMKSTKPPHLIVAGPVGIGKSLAIRSILGSEIALWFRCSQDPSLKADIRDKIKSVARRRIQDGHIHWVILEHADLLHTDAQAFLRRVIETSTGASRFVLEARSLAGISEPLISRATLFNAPILQPYEIRAEVQRRTSLPLAICETLGTQCDGSIRWAVLQGLAQGTGFIDDSVSLTQKPDESKWSYVLRVMEEIQKSGTNPKALLGGVWDRPGGICPWALIAKTVITQ
jgi:replication-associated recombination protein RarA